METMSPDVLVVRDDDRYRILHGHLHLVSEMSRTDELTVDASGEGNVKVVKTAEGIFISGENRHFPIIGIFK
jgi:hypothetical protein